MEQWRDHPTYNLQVSSEGRVRGSRKLRKFRVDRYGYSRLNCHFKGKVVTVMVHKLVAETWLGPAEGLTVDHKDGNKSNNHYTNLQYITSDDNVRKAFRQGLVGNCIPALGYYSKREAERQTGIARYKL